MKLQKLVYYAHGWHLALTGRPLLNDSVEMWEYGPVIPNLYKEFRGFGNKPIDIMASDPVVSSKDEDFGFPEFSWTYPRIETDTDDSDDDKEIAKSIIKRVWDTYGKLSATKLSNMTHAEGTPWALMFKGLGGVKRLSPQIPNDLIEKCFNQERLSRRSAQS
jgi:uncharacterized phage-associated protein